MVQEFPARCCFVAIPHRVKIILHGTVATKNLRHKSDAFHGIIILHMFILIKFSETSRDKTNKTRQKVTG